MNSRQDKTSTYNYYLFLVICTIKLHKRHQLNVEERETEESFSIILPIVCSLAEEIHTQADRENKETKLKL